jgi:hypothetical protein
VGRARDLRTSIPLVREVARSRIGLAWIKNSAKKCCRKFADAYKYGESAWMSHCQFFHPHFFAVRFATKSPTGASLADARQADETHTEMIARDGIGDFNMLPWKGDWFLKGRFFVLPG